MVTPKDRIKSWAFRRPDCSPRGGMVLARTGVEAMKLVHYAYGFASYSRVFCAETDEEYEDNGKDLDKCVNGRPEQKFQPWQFVIVKSSNSTASAFGIIQGSAYDLGRGKDVHSYAVWILKPTRRSIAGHGRWVSDELMELYLNQDEERAKRLVSQYENKLRKSQKG